MSIQSITTKVISTLGNKESLIPIIVKDGVDSTALTVKSFKEGGAVEGMDRFVDEFGTQAIWVGGIPFFKKLIDWTAYKFAKISPEVDPRILQKEDYAKWAKNNAKGFYTKKKLSFKNGKIGIQEAKTSVKEAMDKCFDNQKLTKNLFKSKIAIATALTLGTFFLLTKTKQKNTKNTVLKDMNKSTFENNDTISINNKIKHPEVFADIANKNKTQMPSFKGGVKKLAEAIMFNPVHNMKIIDAGITTERLACSRNKTELAEHAIKEGSFLFFLYGFGNLIEKGINKISDKKFKVPIDMEIDAIMDKKLSEALEKNTIISDIAKLPDKAKGLTEKLDFIVNNPDNIVVQAAKKSKIISTVKDEAGKSVVDTTKFIDMDDFYGLANKLKNMDDKFKLSDGNVKKFLNKTKGSKVASVIANIGISCLFLGYLVPKAVYKYREHKTGTTKFHVEQDIKNTNNKKPV